jgi:hypothetical protein
MPRAMNKSRRGKAKPEPFYLGLEFQGSTAGERSGSPVTRILVARYAKSAAGEIEVSPRCASYRGLCRAVAALKRDLDAIREAAGAHFADRRVRNRPGLRSAVSGGGT